MPASLAIHALRARLPARAQPVAARLALQALGADLEDALPRSLPPQALLWLRRLQLQAPEAALLRPAPPGWRRDWVAAGRERLDAALAHAARPALGPVPADAEAVLFADAAEMLACLALAARAGQLDRWWWRGLLGRSWPHWQTAWAARPQAQAAAQRLLQRAGQGRVAAFDAGGPADDVAELGVAVSLSETVASPPERVAAGLGEVAVEPLRRESPAVEGLPAVFARPAAAADDDVAATKEVEAKAAAAPGALPTAPIEVKPSQQVPRLEASRPAPLPAGIERAPQAGKASVARQQLSPARPVVQVDAELASPDEAASAPRATQRAQWAAAPHAGPQSVASPSPQSMTHQSIATPFEALQTEQRPQPVVASPDAIALGLPESPARPEALPSPPAAMHREHAEPVAADAAWPWPQALLSRQAPLLFVVNLLLEDGLYPDFTRPCDRGLPVPLWAFLASLARTWRLPVDTLHTALAQRAGDWAQPEWLPAAPGAPAGPWSLWLPAYARSLRRRLCRRLGLRTAQWPAALTLAHPARLWLSEAEWVAEFDLAGHDVAWRLAGLDRDPGWLPAVDCSLRFEFR